MEEMRDAVQVNWRREEGESAVTPFPRWLETRAWGTRNWMATVDRIPDVLMGAEDTTG